MRQEDFAGHLGVDQSLISAWEGGLDKPSPQMWLKLGNLAAQLGHPSATRWCWKEAGMDTGVLPQVYHEILKDISGTAEPGEFRVVNPTSKIEQDAGAPPLRFPSSMIPNPEKTCYVRISRRLLAPLLEPEGTLIIDESETAIEKLEGACVAIYDPAKTNIEIDVVTAGTGDRFTRPLPILHEGVFAAWVLREENGDRLAASFPSRYGSIYRDPLVTASRLSVGAIILGRVIAWIPAARDSRAEHEEQKK